VGREPGYPFQFLTKRGAQRPFCSGISVNQKSAGFLVIYPLRGWETASRRFPAWPLRLQRKVPKIPSQKQAVSGRVKK
jgi:hypothetical protein